MNTIRELPSEKVIREMKYPKKDKWKPIAIILIIICIGAGIYFGYNYVYKKGLRDGANSLLTTQTNTQEFYFYCNQTLRKGSFNLNCEGLNP